MEDERHGHTVTMKTDENVEKLRTLVRKHSRLGIRILTKELNVEKK
jgi:hypothetical protein